MVIILGSIRLWYGLTWVEALLAKGGPRTEPQGVCWVEGTTGWEKFSSDSFWVQKAFHYIIRLTQAGSLDATPTWLSKRWTGIGTAKQQATVKARRFGFCFSDCWVTSMINCPGGPSNRSRCKPTKTKRDYVICIARNLRNLSSLCSQELCRIGRTP